MNVGSYKGAAALTALDQWQQSIAQNLAYAAVIGYKRDQANFNGVMSDVERLKSGDNVTRVVKGSMPKIENSVDPTPAANRYTGVETDFSIDGPGFFRVRKPDGSLAYTRSGEFRLNQDRVLVTQKGYQVEGENGPIQFQQQGGRIFINQIGMIVQGSQQIGRIGVFRFNDPENLKRAGDSLLVPREGQTPTPVETASLVHMTLEESNVQPMKEAISMVMVSRAYEASRKVIEVNDEIIGKAIQNLAGGV
jgi:flagellar basal-body rod protein FlgF